MGVRIGVQGPPGAGPYSTLYSNAPATLNTPRMLPRPPKGWSPDPAGLLSADVVPGGKLGPVARPWGSMREVGMKPTSVITGGGGHSQRHTRRQRTTHM